jgi:hypothetical protein
VGPLLTAVTAAFDGAASQPFLLARLTERRGRGCGRGTAPAAAAGRAPRSKLVLRARPGAAAGQLLSELRAEAAAAARRLPVVAGADVSMLGCGQLLKAGGARVKVVTDPNASRSHATRARGGGAAAAEAMAPAAAASLAAALLRQAAPAGWTVLE